MATGPARSTTSRMAAKPAPSTTSPVDAAGAARLERANAEKQRLAGTKYAGLVTKRLRFLDDATLRRLAKAVWFEQLIRAQAATMDDDGDGER